MSIKGVQWTKDLVSWLKKEYPSHSTPELAVQSDLSISAIENKAHKLGLKKHINNRGIEMKIDLKKQMDEFASLIVRRVNAMPPIKVDLKPYAKKRRGEEDAVLLLSDSHVGIKTNSYDSKVFKARMKGILAAVREITDIHRQAYPINTIHIFMLGDIVHNDLIGRFITLDELEMPVINQFIDVAVPEIEKLILSLKRDFKTVNVYGVRGNHGLVHKFAAQTTNWDSIIYRIIAMQMRNQKRINIKLTNDFYQIVTVQGHRFLLVHGDQIPMHLTLPWYGTTTRAMRWQGSMPQDFKYMCHGHFHFPSIIQWNEMEILANGTFVTDDEYVRKKLGLKSLARQIFFGVHPSIGITWRYRINPDYAEGELITPKRRETKL